MRPHQSQPTYLQCSPRTVAPPPAPSAPKASCYSHHPTSLLAHLRGQPAHPTNPASGQSSSSAWGSTPALLCLLLLRLARHRGCFLQVSPLQPAKTITEIKLPWTHFPAPAANQSTQLGSEGLNGCWRVLTYHIGPLNRPGCQPESPHPAERFTAPQAFLRQTTQTVTNQGPASTNKPNAPPRRLGRPTQGQYRASVPFVVALRPNRPLGPAFRPSSRPAPADRLRALLAPPNRPRCPRRRTCTQPKHTAHFVDSLGLLLHRPCSLGTG